MKARFTWFVLFVAATAWLISFGAFAGEDSGAGCPDYGNVKSWAALPDKIDKPVDVFFVHPTTYMDQKDGMNASLDNKEVNAESKSTVERQAGVFTGACNLYAPRYRQASLAVLSLDEKKREKYLNVGMEDVQAAFTYYMKHFNKGRPVILAAHSQGSNVLMMLLESHPALIPRDRLVAAYIIGWSVTDDDLHQLGLPLGKKPDQTGCVITWNTISDGGKSPVILPGARCVNPLTWSTDTANAPAELNIYALIKLEDGSRKRIPHFTSARIDPGQGGLVIPVPAINGELNHIMGPGVYHAYDYDFFYGNLVENVKTRCDSWLKGRKQDRR